MPLCDKFEANGHQPHFFKYFNNSATAASSKLRRSSTWHAGDAVPNGAFFRFIYKQQPTTFVNEKLPHLCDRIAMPPP